MQQIVIDNIIGKNNLNISDIDLLVGGDLTNQIAISNYSAKIIIFLFGALFRLCYVCRRLNCCIKYDRWW